MERGGAGAEGLGGPGDGAAPREGAPRRGLPPDVLRPVCGDLEIRHPARAPPEECEEDPRELAAVPASGGGRGEGAGGDCWGKPSGSEPEQERRQQLAQGVARLRGELQQLDLQTETAQREVMADEVSLEAAQERIRDAQRRSLLLKAYAARLAKERQQLQGSVAQLRGRLEQLKDISRKAGAGVRSCG
ncbi:HAUS augmin-like complex subunit 5 isoform X5 [Eretmochelys imbricata]